MEQLFCDEVQRRDADSAGVRARAAHLDPTMVLEAWDETAEVTYDTAVWSELVSLRFVEQARNALVLGSGRRREDVPRHRPRPHRLPTAHRRALRAGRPAPQAAEGGTPRRELRRRDAQADRRRAADHRRLRLQPLDATETADVYELVVERHHRAATVLTSNRDPSEWLAMMADPLLAQSAVDRLKSAAWELVIEGSSYRQREKPRLDVWPEKPPTSRRHRGA